jgi:hypothetical protein
MTGNGHPFFHDTGYLILDTGYWILDTGDFHFDGVSLYAKRFIRNS